MVRKKPNALLIAMFFALFCGISGRYAYNLYKINSQQAELKSSAAKQFASMGAMSQDDYYRVSEISDTIKKTHSISDPDLDWWIQLVNRPASSRIDQLNGSICRLFALSDGWKYLTQATPEQKDKLFEIEKMYLAPRSSLSGGDQSFAFALVAYLDERRAAPYLRPFLQRSPKSDLRRLSAKLLDHWDYQDSHQK